MEVARILTSHLGTALFVAILYLSWLLKIFGRRMGEVTRMQPYYKTFDLGNILILVATLSYILVCSAALSKEPLLLLEPTFMLIAFYIPLMLGVGLNLSIAIIYWGWLIKER